MKLYKMPVLYLSILSVAAFVLSFMYNTSSAPLELFFTAETSLFIFTLAIIGMSFMFFGYGTPIMAFFAGLYAALQPDQLVALFATVITMVVGYSSIRMGVSLLHDLQGKKNFRETWKKTSFLLAIVIVFSLIWGI